MVNASYFTYGTSGVGRTDYHRYLQTRWSQNGAEEGDAAPYTRAELPETHANVVSRWTFWWFESLVWRGWRRPLEDSDLYDMIADDKAELLSQRFQKAWREYMAREPERMEKRRRRLLKKMMRRQRRHRQDGDGDEPLPDIDEEQLRSAAGRPASRLRQRHRARLHSVCRPERLDLQRHRARQHPLRLALRREVVSARSVRQRAQRRFGHAAGRRPDRDRREGHQPERRPETAGERGAAGVCAGRRERAGRPAVGAGCACGRARVRKGAVQRARRVAPPDARAGDQPPAGGVALRLGGGDGGGPGGGAGPVAPTDARFVGVSGDDGGAACVGEAGGGGAGAADRAPLGGLSVGAGDLLVAVPQGVRGEPVLLPGVSVGGARPRRGAVDGVRQVAGAESGGTCPDHHRRGGEPHAAGCATSQRFHAVLADAVGGAAADRRLVDAADRVPRLQRPDRIRAGAASRAAAGVPGEAAVGVSQFDVRFHRPARQATQRDVPGRQGDEAVRVGGAAVRQGDRHSGAGTGGVSADGADAHAVLRSAVRDADAGDRGHFWLLRRRVSQHAESGEHLRGADRAEQSALPADHVSVRDHGACGRAARSVDADDGDEEDEGELDLKGDGVRKPASMPILPTRSGDGGVAALRVSRDLLADRARTAGVMADEGDRVTPSASDSAGRPSTSSTDSSAKGAETAKIKGSLAALRPSSDDGRDAIVVRDATFEWSVQRTVPIAPVVHNVAAAVPRWRRCLPSWLPWIGRPRPPSGPREKRLVELTVAVPKVSLRVPRGALLRDHTETTFDDATAAADAARRQEQIKDKQAGELVVTEEIQRGHVPLRVYWRYAKDCGSPLLFLVLLVGAFRPALAGILLGHLLRAGTVPRADDVRAHLLVSDPGASGRQALARIPAALGAVRADGVLRRHPGGPHSGALQPRHDADRLPAVAGVQLVPAAVGVDCGLVRVHRGDLSDLRGGPGAGADPVRAVVAAVQPGQHPISAAGQRQQGAHLRALQRDAQRSDDDTCHVRGQRGPGAGVLAVGDFGAEHGGALHHRGGAADELGGAQHLLHRLDPARAPGRRGCAARLAQPRHHSVRGGVDAVSAEFAAGAAGRVDGDRGRRAGGRAGAHWLGQVVAHRGAVPAGGAVGRRQRSGADRRRRYCRAEAAAVARAADYHPAGSGALLWHRAHQPRSVRAVRGSRLVGCAAQRQPGYGGEHHVAGAGVAGVGVRGESVGRPTAVDLPGAGAVAASAHFGQRRGHLVGGLADRSADPGGDTRQVRARHRDCHRAPAVHAGRFRHRAGHEPRPRGRARRPRRVAAAAARPVYALCGLDRTAGQSSVPRADRGAREMRRRRRRERQNRVRAEEVD
eukprot:ctg_1633.g518